MGHKCWFCMLCLISDQGSLKTVWNYGCVKQGSVDDCCTLVYWFWGCDYVPRGKIIFITIATASHCRVSSIWVTFTLWGHTWKCIIWMFLAVINEHHWKKAVSTPMLFITNIAKGTTDPGVDCFDQSSWFGRFGSVCLVGWVGNITLYWNRRQLYWYLYQ